MKRKLEILAVAVALTASLARAQTIEDGLYAIVDSGGVIVKALDGSDIHLGEKLPDKVERAAARSHSNDNERFTLELQKSTPFSRDPRSVAICLGSGCIRYTGGSTGPRDYRLYIFDSPREVADAFAKFFHIVPLRRAHPGYAVATRFVPAKESFAVGESVQVNLEIKNVGLVPVTFQVGGQNRGSRDNQFGFTAYGPGGAVPDTGDPNHMGGMSYNPTLKPGEVFRKDVDLTKWFAFTKPGGYTINGSYDLEFFNPTDTADLPIWRDEATASFTITIR